MLIASNNNSGKRKRDTKSSSKEKGKQKPLSEKKFKISPSKPKTTEVVANHINLLLIIIFSLI